MIKSRWRHCSGGAFLILFFASFCASAQTAQPAYAKVDTKTGAITGRVVNENGEPHVNIEVLVRPATPQELPGTQIITNREGVFNVSDLQRGSYNVSATGPAHIPKSPYGREVVCEAGDVDTLH